jgi:nanoRNase/pAp phosphatase (c-di-AMP/oligoRNAs hydrolase)
LLKHYDWLVLAGSEGCSPETTKLSFRTNRNDVNIGQYLKELGRGGGGHPKAAGQLIPITEKDEFINQVAEGLFGPH